NSKWTRGLFAPVLVLSACSGSNVTSLGDASRSAANGGCQVVFDQQKLKDAGIAFPVIAENVVITPSAETSECETSHGRVTGYPYLNAYVPNAAAAPMIYRESFRDSSPLPVSIKGYLELKEQGSISEALANRLGTAFKAEPLAFKGAGSFRVKPLKF